MFATYITQYTFNNIKINDDGIVLDGINVINYQIINLNELNNEYIFPNKSIIIISDFKNCNFTISNYKTNNDESNRISILKKKIELLKKSK